MQKDIVIPISSDKSNAALVLHTLFSQLPVIFREHVCEECNWSTPTFYRKIRIKDIVNPENPKQVISAISKAEKEKIIEIGVKLFEQMGLQISKHDSKMATNKN